MGFGSGHLGQPSGFKAGFGEGGGFAPPSGFVWTNAQAEAYYDALVVANGGVEDLQDDYGLSLDQFRTAINTCFVSLNSLGALSLIKRWTPNIGNISATMCINAITPGTYNGIYTAGVSFSNSGLTFNGTSGEENSQFLGTNFTAFDNMGTSWFNVDYTITDYAALYSDTSATKIYCYKNPTTRYDAFPCSANYIASNIGSSAHFFTTTRVGQLMESYVDGVQVNNGAPSDTLTLPATTISIGGAHLGLGWFDGTIRHMMFHDGLTPTQATGIYNAILAFDTALGR